MWQVRRMEMGYMDRGNLLGILSFRDWAGKTVDWGCNLSKSHYFSLYLYIILISAVGGHSGGNGGCPLRHHYTYSVPDVCRQCVRAVVPQPQHSSHLLATQLAFQCVMQAHVRTSILHGSRLLERKLQWAQVFATQKYRNWYWYVCLYGDVEHQNQASGRINETSLLYLCVRIITWDGNEYWKILGFTDDLRGGQHSWWPWATAWTCYGEAVRSPNHVIIGPLNGHRYQGHSIYRQPGNHLPFREEIQQMRSTRDTIKLVQSQLLVIGYWKRWEIEQRIKN